MIEIIKTVDHEDGSANLTIEMDYESMKIFAARGLLDTIKEYIGKQNIEVSGEVDWGKPIGKEVW